MINAGATITPEEVWTHLLDDRIYIIDVRAPIEFKEGRVPTSVNHPLLNDNERMQVGTTYKQEGSEAAIALGHRLIQGETKNQRVEKWIDEIKKTEKIPIITCFRGGLRSQISQSWLAERGIMIPRIAGGYKKMRQLLNEKIDDFCRNRKMWILTGKTGAGKTQFLNQIKNFPTLNLEFLAKHRGSAFGSYKEAQPTQIDFENMLAMELGRLSRQAPSTPIIVEDESRLIGRCVQPENFFNHLRASPVLFLEEPLSVRVENTFQEYVFSRVSETGLRSELELSLGKIKNKLGGLRYSEILADMKHPEIEHSRVWIAKLLQWYYDPMYESSFQKRNPQVLVHGSHEVIQRYMEDSLSAM